MINFTRGAFRRRIEVDEALALDRAGVLIRDERRRRPFYFDGRFLTARDLTREQNYFLARQAELGRAAGNGVITGLNVSFDNASFLRIEAGHGITSTGEIVTLTTPLRINLADISESQELDARFGISATPRPPSHRRSGVFIVALRPVEFTANPISSYPQSLTGPRSVEDGEIVEAAAVTLIPFSDETAPAERSRQQAQIAKQMFLRRDPLQPSQNALPLAMISVSGGVVNWLDVFMVRREVGADHGDTLGFGFSPRALREAQFLQYRDQLSGIVTRRAQTNQSLRFAASEYFHVLPPAGPLPLAAVDTNTFTQSFFPPVIPVELSVIPEDELRVLVEDALLLPPIDLSLRDQEMASTSILILAPIARSDYQKLEAGVEVGAPLAPVPPTVPKLFAGRRPLELLSVLALKNQSLPVETRQLTADDRWRRATAQLQSQSGGATTPMLWFVRRRNFTQKPELAGRPVRPFVDDLTRERAFLAMLPALQAALAIPAPVPPALDFTARWNTLKANANATLSGLSIVVETLVPERFRQKPLTVLVALALFESTGPRELNARRVTIAIGDQRFGNGIERLQSVPAAAAPPNGVPPAFLDAFARQLAAFPRLAEFDQLLEVASQQTVNLALSRLVTAAGVAPNFQLLVTAWLNAKAIS